MCNKKSCCNIEIIEIHRNIKVVLHYNKDGRPIFIQYWNENRNINEDYKRFRKKNKYKCEGLELEVIELLELV